MANTESVAKQDTLLTILNAHTTTHFTPNKTRLVGQAFGLVVKTLLGISMYHVEFLGSSLSSAVYLRFLPTHSLEGNKYG